MKKNRPTYGVGEAIFLHRLTDKQRRIYDFCASVRRGKVDPQLLQYITDAFERHMVGEAKSVDEALGLKRGRGGIKKRSLEEHAYRVELAMAVLVAKEQTPERNLDLIYEDLVELYSEKPSFVQDCYEKHRKEGVRALHSLRLSESDTAGAAIIGYFDLMEQGGGARLISPPKNLKLPSK